MWQKKGNYTALFFAPILPLWAEQVIIECENHQA